MTFTIKSTELFLCGTYVVQYARLIIAIAASSPNQKMEIQTRMTRQDELDEAALDRSAGAERFARSVSPPPLLLRAVDAAHAQLSTAAVPPPSVAAFDHERCAFTLPALDGAGVRLGVLTPAPLWATLQPQAAASEEGPQHALPLAWSPDGAFLAVGDSASASVWLCTWTTGDDATVVPSAAAPPSQLLLVRAELRLWLTTKELAGATRVVTAFFSRTALGLFALLDNGLLVKLDVRTPQLQRLTLERFAEATDEPVEITADVDVKPLVHATVVKRLTEWHASVEAAAVDAASATLVVTGGLRSPSDALVRSRASSLSVWRVLHHEPFCELLDYTMVLNDSARDSAHDREPTAAPADASGLFQALKRVLLLPLTFLVGVGAGRDRGVLLQGSVRQLAVAPDGAHVALVDADGRLSVRQIDACSSVLGWQRVPDNDATGRIQSVLWLSTNVLGFVLTSGRVVYGVLTTRDSDESLPTDTVGVTHTIEMLSTQLVAPNAASGSVQAVAGVSPAHVGTLAGIQVVADSAQVVVQRFETVALSAFVELLTASQQFDRALSVVAAYGDSAESELEAVHRQIWTHFCDHARVDADNDSGAHSVLLATDTASGFLTALAHLQLVRDKRWVVAECRKAIATDSFVDMRAILETGLLASTGIADSDTDSDSDSARQQFQRWLYRLDTFRLVLAEDVVEAHVAGSDDPERVAEQCYDGAVFASFRRASVVSLALQLARDARVGALRVLFQRNGWALVPHRLDVLAQLPASVSPFAYSDLLPAVGPDATADDSDATTPRFFTLQPQTAYQECDDPLNSSLGSVSFESRVVAVDLSVESRCVDTDATDLAVFDHVARESPREKRDTYVAWFRSRILEMDTVFGQLASAYQLSSLARECVRGGNWHDSDSDSAKSAFDSFQHDVERLYYCVYPLALSSCTVLSLAEWTVLSPHDQIVRVLGDWDCATDAVDRIQAVFVAHRRDALFTLDAAFTSLCATLARTHSLAALEVCAQLVHHSNPALPVVERWIQNDAQLLRTALSVVYAAAASRFFPTATERRRHHRAFVEQLWTIFQSLPVRKPDDSPEIAQLQVAVDEMEDLLVAMDVLSKYGVLSSPSELRELVGASTSAADDLLAQMCAFALSGTDSDSKSPIADEQASEVHPWMAVWHDALKLKTHVFGERLSQDAILDCILRHLLTYDTDVAAAEHLATNWISTASDAGPYIVNVLLTTVQAKVDTLRGAVVSDRDVQMHARALQCVELTTRVLSLSLSDDTTAAEIVKRQLQNELSLVDACELLDLLSYGALKLSPADVRSLYDATARLALVLDVFASNPSNYQPSTKARAWFVAHSLEHVLSPTSAPLDAVMYVATLLGVDNEAQTHQIRMKGAYAALYCADYDVAYSLTSDVVARLTLSDAGSDSDDDSDDLMLSHLLSLVLDLVSATSFRAWTQKLTLCRAVLSAPHVSSTRMFEHPLTSRILSRMEQLEAVEALAAELGLSETTLDERRRRDGVANASVEQLLLSELELVVELLQEEKNDRGFLLRLLQKGFQLVGTVLAGAIEEPTDADTALSLSATSHNDVERAERMVQQLTRVCFADAIDAVARVDDTTTLLSDWRASVAIGGSYLRLWSDFTRDEHAVEAFYERDVVPLLSTAFATSQSATTTKELERLVRQLHHLFLVQVASIDDASVSDDVATVGLAGRLHESRLRFDELASSYDATKQFVASRPVESDEPLASDDTWTTSDNMDADSVAPPPVLSRVATRRRVFAHLATRCRDAMLSQQKTQELEAMSTFLNAELDLDRFNRDATYRERTILTLATKKEYYATATQFATKYGVDVTRCLFAYIQSALLAPSLSGPQRRHEQLERAFQSDGDDFLEQALHQPVAFSRLLLNDDDIGASLYDALDGTDHVGLLLVLRMVLECSKRIATLSRDTAAAPDTDKHAWFPLSKASTDRVTLLFMCLKRLKELEPLRTRDGHAAVVDFKVVCAAATGAALLSGPSLASAIESRRAAVAAVLPFLTGKSIKLLTKLFQKLHSVSTSAVVMVYLSSRLGTLWAEHQQPRYSASDAADLAATAYDACTPFFSVLSNDHLLLVHCLLLGRRHNVVLAIDTVEEFYGQPIDGFALYARFFSPLKRVTIISETLALFQTRFDAWLASPTPAANSDTHATLVVAKQSELRFLQRELAQAALWFVASEVTRHGALFALGDASWQLWERRMREWFVSLEATTADQSSLDRQELVHVLALLCQSVSSVDTASLMVELVLLASQCDNDTTDTTGTLSFVYEQAFVSFVMTQLDSDATHAIINKWAAWVPDAHTVVSKTFRAVATFLQALSSPSTPPARQLHTHVVSQLTHVSSAAVTTVANAVANAVPSSTGVAHAAVVAAWRRLSAQWDDERQYALSSVLARLMLDTGVVSGDSERAFFGLQTKAVVAHLSSSSAQASHALNAVLSIPAVQVYERFDTVFASVIALIDSPTTLGDDVSQSRTATLALANLLSFHAHTTTVLLPDNMPQALVHTWAAEQRAAVATRIQSQFGLEDDSVALSRPEAVVVDDNDTDSSSAWWAALLLRGDWGDDATLLTWYQTTAFGHVRSPRAVEAFATAHWSTRRRVCVQLLLTAPFPALHTHHRERLLSFAAADSDATATTTTALELLLLRFDVRELLAAGLYPQLLPLFLCDDDRCRSRLWTACGEYAVCALVALNEVATAARLACALWRVHPLLWDFANARLTLANYLKALATERSNSHGDRTQRKLRRAVYAQVHSAFQRTLLLSREK